MLLDKQLIKDAIIRYHSCADTVLALLPET